MRAQRFPPRCLTCLRGLLRTRRVTVLVSKGRFSLPSHPLVPAALVRAVVGASWLCVLPEAACGWHRLPHPLLHPLGVDTDELDSNVDDWEEETIEFFVTEEIIPLGSQE